MPITSTQLPIGDVETRRIRESRPQRVGGPIV
jgi:hypothetical protein